MHDLISTPVVLKHKSYVPPISVDFGIVEETCDALSCYLCGDGSCSLFTTYREIKLLSWTRQLSFGLLKLSKSYPQPLCLSSAYLFLFCF